MKPLVALAGSTPEERASRSATALALVSALLTAAVGYACIARAPLLPNQDAIHYLSLAEHLARGQGYTSSLHLFDDRLQPPLYPLLVSVGIRLGASSLASAIGVCLVAEALTTVALLRIHAALAGEDRTGPYCAAIAIAYPNLAIGVQLTLEPVFVCALAWSACFVLTSLARRDVRRAAAGGACLALACLARSEAVLSLAVLSALVVVDGSATRRRRAASLAALLGSAALVLLPYGLWMRSELGYFEVLPKVRYNMPLAAILREIAWSPDDLAAPDRLERILFSLMPDRATFVLDYAFRHPGFDAVAMYPRGAPAPLSASLLALAHTAREVVSEAVSVVGLFQPVATLLLGVAALSMARRSMLAPGSMLPTLAVLALVAANLAPAFVSGEDFSRRYLSASLMWSVPAVSAGAARSLRWVSAFAPRARRGAAVALGLALVLSYGRLTWRLVRSTAPDHDRTDAIELAAASVLPEGARVLSDRHRYAFLRHGHGFHLPYVKSLDELTSYIGHHGIDYAIFDSMTLKQKPGRVSRAVLVDPAQWPAAWTPLAVLAPRGEPVWIVRLR